MQPEPGYSQVNCIGSEEGLESCIVGDLMSESCSQVGVVLHCFNSNEITQSIDLCTCDWLALCHMCFS